MAGELLARNQLFAQDEHEELPLAPKLRTLIVACPDPRVDPAHVLGLEPGDAAVLRTVGGRMTPAVMMNMAMLRQVAAAEGASGAAELVLLQHTDCGIKHLEEPEFADLMAAYFGVGVDELEAKEIGDPYAAVKADIEALAANPLLPETLSVSGLVYDVASGNVELVDRRSPLRQPAGE